MWEWELMSLHRLGKNRLVFVTKGVKDDCLWPDVLAV